MRSSIPLLAVLIAPSIADTYKGTPQSNPGSLGQPFDGFTSYSIEFSSFPDFAGNLSHPNSYSYNLLRNLQEISGHSPYIRVGGNTQDFALYNASQKEGLIGIVDPARSPDYPTTITIGKAFFESYKTWPGVLFSHGFNMGLGAITSKGWDTLKETAPLVCDAFGHGRFYSLEYGNEPDLFSNAPYGPRNASTWTDQAYVAEWLNGTAEITMQFQKHCPSLFGKKDVAKFMAPSMASINGQLHANACFADGLNSRENVALFSTHNYISGAKSPGVTLQGTLMNHTVTKTSVDKHTKEYNATFGGKAGSPPLIFGEGNSLYNQGRPGLSNTFGAALWGVDFHLYSASVGFKRVHFHQGTNYRYQAWQPVGTNVTEIGTKAPYYGDVAVSMMTGRINWNPVTISSIALSGNDDRHAAYAAHCSSRGNQKLARVMIINMRSYNTTKGGEGIEPVPNPPQRPLSTYEFEAPGVPDGRKVTVHRLYANGSDAITGITYDGVSYNHELNNGKPVQLKNVTIGETVKVKSGVVTVDVQDSSAALLYFGC